MPEAERFRKSNLSAFLNFLLAKYEAYTGAIRPKAPSISRGGQSRIAELPVRSFKGNTVSSCSMRREAISSSSGG